MRIGLVIVVVGLGACSVSPTVAPRAEQARAPEVRPDDSRLTPLAGATPADAGAAAGDASPGPGDPAADSAFGPEMQDHGSCASGLGSWEEAERWARSFRGPNRHYPEGGAEAALRRDHDVSIAFEGGLIRGYVQEVEVGHGQEVRRFLFAEGLGGIAGCLLFDDLLVHGYLQSPTPVERSLRVGATRLSFEARHRWSGATLLELGLEAHYQVHCRFAGDFGCVILPTHWVDYEYRGHIQPPVRHAATAVVEETEDGAFRWREGGRRLEMGIEAWHVQRVDQRREGILEPSSRACVGPGAGDRGDRFDCAP